MEHTMQLTATSKMATVPAQVQSKAAIHPSTQLLLRTIHPLRPCSVLLRVVHHDTLRQALPFSYV
jgi:hypothetical protein